MKPEDKLDAENVAFQMIVHAGEGRAKVYEAIRAYGDGRQAVYESLMEEAEQALASAHALQTRYLQAKALEGGGSPDFLLVHAQDILMSATSERELAMALVRAFERRFSRDGTRC